MNLLRRWISGWVLFGLLVCLSAQGGAVPDQPWIESIEVEGKMVVVKVAIPAGIKRVTLEGRTRADGGAWTPRAVARPEKASAASVVVIRLPLSESVELLRARADANEALPGGWYGGTNQFSGAFAGSGAVVPGVTPTFLEGAPSAADTLRTAVGDKAARTVVESDIWQVDGDRVYFFNQYRGLQVIDVSNPDQPRLEGTLPMSMAGEQMYVLEGGYVVLLARDNCQGSSSEQQSVVMVVKTRGGLGIVSATPLDGTIVESRMVGTALYAASQRYRLFEKPGPPVPDPSIPSSTYWEWGTQLVSIDLADPIAPKRRSELWTAGYQAVIHATDQYFFLSNADPRADWRSVVRVVDISSPDGTMKSLSEIRPLGRIADKFKLDLNGDVLALVSERWDNTIPNPNGNLGRWATRVETYSMADGADPKKLGGLDLGFGERLFATRFDGKRLYAVTFLRIDPLWVIDLSNPVKPAVFGELEIPGWSNYIHPMGDRLVSVGVETNRVAVSLFDVADPSKPALLSRVRLGENYSWSEANYDEKAFSVFEEEGLVMLPYQGYTTNGYASRVQLIDLAKNALTQRGIIEHTFQPRRTALKDGRILSISGEALLVVDAVNRDEPKVKARLELAWPADRVFKSGSHLLAVIDGGYGYGSNVPGLRVALASAPDASLTTLDLVPAAGQVLGAEVQAGRAYVLQGVSTEIQWKLDVRGQYVQVGTNQASLTLTVVDLSGLPALRVLGSTTHHYTNEQYWSQFQALWLENGTLVWNDQSYAYPIWARGGLAAVDSISIRGGPWWGGWGWGGGTRLTAYGFDAGGNPKLLSSTRVSDTNSWWNFSQPKVSGSKVYLSHQSYEFLPGVLQKGQEPPKPVTIVDSSGEKVQVVPEFGTWIQRYFLDVIDFADPAVPVVRKPVNSPGVLRGVSHSGEVIYTMAPHWDPVTFQTDGREYLDASAYDGVSVALIDSFPMPEIWPRDVLVHDGRVVLSRPADKANPGNKLEVWKLGANGKFELRSSTALALPAYSMTSGSDWIAVSQENSKMEAFRWGANDALLRVGGGTPSACTWLDLARITGTPSEGFWMPLGIYGIGTISIKP